jgi:hypothetical protein
MLMYNLGMNIKSDRFDHSSFPNEVMDSVNLMLRKAKTGLHFKEISEEHGLDDCLIYGLVKDDEPLYDVEADD